MKKRFSLLQAFFIVAAAVIFTAIAGGILMWSAGFIGPRYSIDFDANEVSAESVGKFNQVMNLLDDGYYKDVDVNVLLEGAVAGMANSLEDPYTYYYSKEQMQLYMEKASGSYVGIGVTVMMDENGLLTVVEPFGGSPAEEAGMMPGDKIVKVDETDVTVITDEDIIINMIKGKEDTAVSITVYRESVKDYVDLSLTRRKIKVINMISEVIDKEIGYIKLNMFDGDSAGDFERHLQALLAQGIKGLVIDLRDNPGGSYTQVIAIADRLLPEGLVVYTEDRSGNKVEEMSDSDELGMPIVIITNGNSASASEILAGAVKDHNKGTIVGTTTFGKGLVQELLPLSDGSGIKYTVSRYFTPAGISIHGVGVEPDIVIDVPEEYKDTPVSRIPREEDVQLDKAIEVIEGEILG